MDSFFKLAQIEDALIHFEQRRDLRLKTALFKLIIGSDQAE